jgi:hypothetical protein
LSHRKRGTGEDANHLVCPVRLTSVPDCYAQLERTHHYLVAAGRRAIESLLPTPDVTWGTQLKRLRVQLDAGKPDCVGRNVSSHNLMEVINQCATLERMLHVLAWAQLLESGLTEYQTVVVCHSSTSSSPDDSEWENDLVLRTEQGLTARFEVSDVVSETNSNGKREKDLRSLRLLALDGSVALAPPASRLFVVVSGEFCSFLQASNPSWKRTGQINYVEHRGVGDTHILEVVRTSDSRVLS